MRGKLTNGEESLLSMNCQIPDQLTKTKGSCHEIERKKSPQPNSTGQSKKKPIKSEPTAGSDDGDDEDE